MSSENVQLPVALLVFMAICGALVISAFTIGLLSFLKAGKSDAADRRRRLKAHAKDPMDPEL